MRGSLRRFVFVSFACAAILVVVLSGCATPRPSATLSLRVSNELGRTITELRKKPCGDIELAFVSIEASRIEPGMTREIQLPRSCVDIVAYDERGRIVGEQRNLRMMPGSKWVLRR